MSNPGQGAEPSATPPAGAQPSTPTAWHGNDFAQLVTAKGWKSPDDALKSYGELEKHLGAPADRLLRLPEKPDAPEWGDIRARVGWKAPEKPEDYGIKPAEGFPAEYASAMAAAFHKAGVPADVVKAIVAANDEFVTNTLKGQGDAAAAARKEAFGKADAALAERFKDKLPQVQEGMQREYQRLGLKPEQVEALEQDLADSGHLGMFRGLLADVAQMRAESPLHQDAGKPVAPMKPEEAQRAIEEKRKDPKWAAAAVQRGTPEAEENIRLNWLAQGVVPDDETVKRLAKGLAATPQG